MSDLDTARVTADLRDQVARLRAERDEARAVVARALAIYDNPGADDVEVAMYDALRALESRSEGPDGGVS